MSIAREAATSTSSAIRGRRLAPPPDPPSPCQATGARAGVFDPYPTLLSGFTEARREATRPLHVRDARFDALFDADTLFFDAVRAPDGQHVVLLGPPLFNLAPAFDGLAVSDAAGGRRLPARLRHLDRHAQVWIKVPARVSTLALDTSLGRVTIPVGDNCSHQFAGRRVLLTRSRNNPLPWILDWIRFNRDVNGADAVLFYDNASSLYTTEELQDAIGRIAGIGTALVVRWPYKYGPQGLNATDYWDSDFCELGAWEHARWTFLADARSVMTGDVDELAFGPRSVFEIAEHSLFGVARYGGRWIVGLNDRGPGDARFSARRHRDYDTALKVRPARNRFGLPSDANRCAAKWTVVPRRCPPRAQWHMHTIKGWLPSYLTRRDVTFGHFRPINTSWKYHRDDAGAFDPALHEQHAGLAAAMARVDWDR